MLEAIVAVLAVSIGVAAVWERKCRELAVVSPVVAVALEAALVVFGTVVAVSAIGGAIGTLIAMGDAGKKTKTNINNVIDTYMPIIDVTIAAMPTGRMPIGWRRDIAASSTVSFSDINGWRYDALAEFPGKLKTIARFHCRQGKRAAADAVIGMVLADDPWQSGADFTPLSTAATLDKLAERCWEAAESFGPGFQDRYFDGPLGLRPQGLTAMVQPVRLAAVGDMRCVDGDVSSMGSSLRNVRPKRLTGRP